MMMLLLSEMLGVSVMDRITKLPDGILKDRLKDAIYLSDILIDEMNDLSEYEREDFINTHWSVIKSIEYLGETLDFENSGRVKFESHINQVCQEIINQLG